MNRILLLQLDGSIPNLALMRIAGHHLRRGDQVELRHAKKIEQVERRLGDDFSQVYASAIFERTRPIAQRLLAVYPTAIIGGTGWDIGLTLEDVGIPDTAPDYSLYPDFQASIGFTQRGCRLKCSFCVVRRKEGAVREAATVWDLWRGDPYPKHLLLLDNDFFGQPNWRLRIQELREGKFRVSFNQGINARMLTSETAEAVASVDYRAGNMKTRRIYTAWDSRKDEHRLFAGLNALVRAGVKPDHIMVYMLIGYWAGETEEDWLYRQQRLRDFGARPYPMPFDRTCRVATGFQRWCCGAYDKRVPWAQWKAAHCDPRKLGTPARRALPLFDTAPGREGCSNV